MIYLDEEESRVSLGADDLLSVVDVILMIAIPPMEDRCISAAQLQCILLFVLSCCTLLADCTFIYISSLVVGAE